MCKKPFPQTTVPLSHLAPAHLRCLLGVFLPSRFSRQVQSGLAEPRAELSSKVTPSSARRTRLPYPRRPPVPCRAVPCSTRAFPGPWAGWVLSRVFPQRWARGETARAKVASSGRSRNNSCEQEVISRGERFNGSVTWRCTKTQPRAAAASWGGCRQGSGRCVGG